MEYIHHYLLEWPFREWSHDDGFTWLAWGNSCAIHSKIADGCIHTRLIDCIVGASFHTVHTLVGCMQYFCNNRKPMLSLLQSGARQVTLLMSTVVTPFLTKLTMICLDCWNTFSRLSFETKCVFFLTRSRNGSIMGLNEYAHATWLTSPNQDLASVIFLGSGC